MGNHVGRPPRRRRRQKTGMLAGGIDFQANICPVLLRSSGPFVRSTAVALSLLQVMYAPASLPASLPPSQLHFILTLKRWSQSSV